MYSIWLLFFDVSVVEDMRIASIGDIFTAIFMGFLMERETTILVKIAIVITLIIVLIQFQPLGTIIYPNKQPKQQPNKIEILSILFLSCLIIAFSCFLVIPITLKRPYSFIFPTTPI